MQTIAFKNRKDGFGSQYQALMSGLAYTRHNKCLYHHTPFDTIAHEQNAKDLDKFTGFKSDSDSSDNVTQIDPSELHKINYAPDPSKYYTKDVVEEIRSMYYSTPKPDNCPYDVAIHIRRGDVSLNNYSDRYTKDEYYLKLIKYLRNKNKNLTFCVYSEGKPNDFKIYTENNVNLRLNYDLQKTFHEMVTAKILIMAKSSLSYSAAILNENTVYYTSFWHKKLDHWLSI